MSMARFKRGKPIMQDYTQSGSAVNAGDVVVINDLACVAHVDIPAFTGGTTKDALAVFGGVYAMTADVNTYGVGTYVSWDPVGQKVTTGAAGTVPFGRIVGLGEDGQLSDTTASTTVLVFHDPSPGGLSLTYNLGATANDNVTNTTAETAFATTAVIPAATLQAGDVIHVTAAAIVNGQNSTNTNNIKLKISTAANTFTAVVATGAVNAAANAVALIDVDLVFTAVGASGSFYAVGQDAFGAQGTATMSPVALGATAINTNLAVTIEVTDTQSAASTGNVTQLLELNVSRRRK